MRYLQAIILVFLIISSAAASQLDFSLEKGKIKEIKNITIINITENISDIINQTNLTDINLTDINITDINLTNITDINLTNITNITDINLTNVTDINLTNITNITDINITDLNLTDINLTNITNITENLTNLITNLTSINETENLTNEIIKNSPSVTTSYFYVNEALVASKAQEEFKYYHQDRLGTKKLTTNNDGLEAGKILTLPFGEEIENTNNEKFTFTGKELDSELYHFDARYYNSDLGKFTSVDPVKDQQDYIYVNNNAVNYIDTDGRQTRAANLDSLISVTLPDTLKLDRAPTKVPTGSTVVIDYPNLNGPLKKGVEAFENAISQKLTFEEAVEQLDFESWKTTKYDKIRSGEIKSKSKTLEEQIYGSQTGLPKLSTFFDGSSPDAICKEYTALSIATLNIAAERNPELFKGKQISVINIYGRIENHEIREINGQKVEVVKTETVAHALLEVKDSTNTYYISGGQQYTKKQLEEFFNKGSNKDPKWTIGGYILDESSIWRNIVIRN